MTLVPEKSTREIFNEEIYSRYNNFSSNLPKITGTEDNKTLSFLQILTDLRKNKISSLVPILPFVFSLRGKPYTLRDHFPFEPFFRFRLPNEIILKTARQVSKSTSLATSSIITSAAQPYFNTLTITPLFEMIRRFSTQYVKNFIEQSPIRNVLFDANCSKSVLTKTFRNGSSMIFSYAFLDAERVRGITADRVIIDEVQDVNYELLDVIFETISASKWQLKQFAGTPKSISNTAHRLWLRSSMAEWCTKCPQQGCGHWNIASIDYDLLDMLGPVHDNISEKEPGLVCAKCRKPLNPRLGGWEHRSTDKELRWQFSGYHVPQPIMPMHYADKQSWKKLILKSQGYGGITQTTFFNEVLGEAWDVGLKILSETEIRNACSLPWKRDRQEALKYVKRYKQIIMSVDWGGGGGEVSPSTGRTQRTSFTSLAMLGLKDNGKIDCIYGERLFMTLAWEEETEIILNLYKQFNCTHLVHDYNGSGYGRTILIKQAGFPEKRLVNVSYVGGGKTQIVTRDPAYPDRPHDVWRVDKPQSLIFTCMAIKHGWIRFFAYDCEKKDAGGIMDDFLAFFEEKSTSKVGTDLYYISTYDGVSDDFAQAVNMGVTMLWFMNKAWPNLAFTNKFKISKEDREKIDPTNLTEN